MTVARVLQQAGYRTALVGKWGLGDAGAAEMGLPRKQGFDQFFGYLNQRHAHNHFPDFLWRNEEKVSLPNKVTPVGGDGAGYATEAVAFADDLFADEAIKFVKENRSRPFFLYWSMVIPHANNERARELKNGAEVPDFGPYADRDWPDPDKGQAAMITRIDGYVGRMLATLQELGLAEKTLVIFTSDNGPHNESRHDLARFRSLGAAVRHQAQPDRRRHPRPDDRPVAGHDPARRGDRSRRVLRRLDGHRRGTRRGRGPRRLRLDQLRADAPRPDREAAAARVPVLGIPRRRLQAGRALPGTLEGHPLRRPRRTRRAVRPEAGHRREDRRRRRASRHRREDRRVSQDGPHRLRRLAARVEIAPPATSRELIPARTQLHPAPAIHEEARSREDHEEDQSPHRHQDSPPPGWARSRFDPVRSPHRRPRSPSAPSIPNSNHSPPGEWWTRRAAASGTGKASPKAKAKAKAKGGGATQAPPMDRPRDEVVAFAVYTHHDGVLKMSAQLFPLKPGEERAARLELHRDGQWTEAARADVLYPGWDAHFRIEEWDNTRDVPYRVRHGEQAMFEGLIRRDPADKDEIVVANMSCNSSRTTGLRPEIVENLKRQDPDLLFFAGDQTYRHTEHTAGWIEFGLQFRDVIRDRPTISIPDDHDVGHGNLWGETRQAFAPSRATPTAATSIPSNT